MVSAPIWIHLRSRAGLRLPGHRFDFTDMRDGVPASYTLMHAEAPDRDGAAHTIEVQSEGERERFLAALFWARPHGPSDTPSEMV